MLDMLAFLPFGPDVTFVTAIPRKLPLELPPRASLGVLSGE